MSWDLFAMKLPEGVRSQEELPDDFVPEPIGPRDEVIRRILEVAPDADFSDPSSGEISGPGYLVEINLGEEDVTQDLAMYVRGDVSPMMVIARILQHLRIGAIDAQSGQTFNEVDANRTFEEWRRWRDQGR